MFPILGGRGGGANKIPLGGKSGYSEKKSLTKIREGWKECKNVHLGDSRKIETANFCNHLSNSN